MQIAHTKTLSLLLSVQQEGSARRSDVFVAKKGAARCEVKRSSVTVRNEEGRTLSSQMLALGYRADAKTRVKGFGMIQGVNN